MKTGVAISLVIRGGDLRTLGWGIAGLLLTTLRASIGNIMDGRTPCTCDEPAAIISKPMRIVYASNHYAFHHNSHARGRLTVRHTYNCAAHEMNHSFP